MRLNSSGVEIKSNREWREENEKLREQVAALTQLMVGQDAQIAALTAERDARWSMYLSSKKELADAQVRILELIQERDGAEALR